MEKMRKKILAFFLKKRKLRELMGKRCLDRKELQEVISLMQDRVDKLLRPFSMSFKLTYSEELYLYLKSHKKCKKVSTLIKLLFPKKVNKEELIRNMYIFLYDMKNDPTFLSLDQAFISSPTEENYNNFISYFKDKSKNLSDSLNINFPFIAYFNVMNDNLLPMFSSLFKNNTYDNYINGKIEFPRRNDYAITIKSVKTGNDIEEIKDRRIAIASLLGQDGEIVAEELLVDTGASGQLAQVAEENGASGEVLEEAEASSSGGSALYDFFNILLNLLLVILQILVV
jgi:hypothetical protein